MHKVLWAFVCLIVVVFGALGGVLAFDTPVKPPPLASISDPFAHVDFSDLPTVKTYGARDGTKLGYRVYEGGGAQVVVLIHGSSDDGSGMHSLAKALQGAVAGSRWQGRASVTLVMLNCFGVHWLNGLPIVAFATSPKAQNLTSVYSFRLAVDFGAPPDYLTAVGRSTKPAALLVGGSDELFFPDRFAPLLKPVRPDLQITMVPGIGHIGMTVTPQGIAAVRKSFLELTAPATG